MSKAGAGKSAETKTKAKTTAKEAPKETKAKAPAKTVEAKATTTAPKAKKAAAPKKVKAETKGRCGGKTCRIENCKGEYKAKGYCRTHYKAWRHGKYGQARFKQCGDASCAKPMTVNRHGLCEEHFQNYFVKGMAQAKPAPAAAEKKEEKKEAVA